MLPIAPENADLEKSWDSVPLQIFPWRFCLFSMLTPVALILLALFSSGECCAGSAWTEIVISIVPPLVCGVVLGLGVPATSRHVKRIGYLSPLVPTLLLAVWGSSDSWGKPLSFSEAIGIILSFFAVAYLIMVSTAGFYFLTHRLRFAEAYRKPLEHFK